MTNQILRVHIGYHKTGSSSTQIALAEAADAGHLPVLYPKAGRLKDWAFAHHQLIEDLRHGNRGSLQAVLEEHKSDPDRPVLISSEDMSMLETNFTLSVLREAFPNHALEVVAVLRNHVDWLRSYYMERIKRNATYLTPMAFFREHRHIRVFSPTLHLARSLGAKLILLNYDSLDLPKDLFPVLTNTEMKVESNIRWNQSLSPQGTFALRKAYLSGLADKAGPGTVIQNAFKLDNQLRPTLEKVDIFSRQDIQHIVNYYAADRASVNTLAGRILLPDDIPQPRGPFLSADEDPEITYFRSYLGLKG